MTDARIASAFSMNFRRFQRYNFKYFSSQEAILFEYLILLNHFFGYTEFFHSTSNITRETGIKRNCIESALHRFVGMGLLSIEVKGFPLVKYFTIHPEVVLREFSHIFEFAEDDELQNETYQLYEEITNFCAASRKQYARKHLQKKLRKKLI